MLEASRQEGQYPEEQRRGWQTGQSKWSVQGWHGSRHWLQEERVVSGQPAVGWDGTEGERFKEQVEVCRGCPAWGWVGRCSTNVLFPSLCISPPFFSASINCLHQSPLTMTINSVDHSYLSLSLSPSSLSVPSIVAITAVRHSSSMLLPLSVIVILLQHCLLAAL